MNDPDFDPPGLHRIGWMGDMLLGVCIAVGAVIAGVVVLVHGGLLP